MSRDPLEELEASRGVPTRPLISGGLPLLPTDPAQRKKIPIGTGVLDYFSAALAEVAKVSYQGNTQHNPGENLHWARGKSSDQYDTIIRHLLERGEIDTDGMRHSAKAAWRCLALLQLELEAAGAPLARGAKLADTQAHISQTSTETETDVTFLNECITRQVGIIDGLRAEIKQLRELK